MVAKVAYIKFNPNIFKTYPMVQHVIFKNVLLFITLKKKKRSKS